MQKRSRGLLAGATLGVIGTVLALCAGALAVAYSGVYDIAANRDHIAGVRWFLERTMHSSVQEHAQAPTREALAAVDITAGAGEYKSMCQQCHAGPGVDRAAWADGMTPLPPNMADAAREWSVGEVKWIVQHGLKYTGMPAFGADHDEATLWNIAAFVKQLPEMTPAQYRAYPEAHSHGAASTHGDTGEASEKAHSHDAASAHGSAAETSEPSHKTADGAEPHGEAGHPHPDGGHGPSH
ncbi:c-type cytochrome [Cognatilysobacter bugurensis]|nr:cytochrome c [Lysobacter bugurensis]